MWCQGLGFHSFVEEPSVGIKNRQRVLVRLQIEIEREIGRKMESYHKLLIECGRRQHGEKNGSIEIKRFCFLEMKARKIMVFNKERV